MDKRRRAELLEQLAAANRTMREAATIAVAMSGASLLCGVVESIVRELGPSEHADAVSDLIMPRRHDGQ